MDIINALFRCLVFYIVIAISYRIMGKREVGELSIMDFIVSIFLAQLASISIENLEDNIFISMGPILLLVLIQLILARLSYKNSKVRNILDGLVEIQALRTMEDENSENDSERIIRIEDVEQYYKEL